MMPRPPAVRPPTAEALLTRALDLDQQAAALLARDPRAAEVARQGLRGRGKGLDRPALLLLASKAAPEHTEARRLLDEATALRWQAVATWRPLALGMGRKWGAAPSEDDAVSVATEGLFEAAKRWSPDAGALFQTYAKWWVRARLARTFPTAGDRLKSGAAELLRNARKLEAQGLTDPQIADRLEVTVERLHQIRAAAAPLKSLDEPVGDSDDRHLHDVVPAPEPDLVGGLDATRVLVALERLDRRSRKILALRFGLGGDGEGLTLTEVGEGLGVSRERVRQIERAALDELREMLSASSPRPPRRRRDTDPGEVLFEHALPEVELGPREPAAPAPPPAVVAPTAPPPEPPEPAYTTHQVAVAMGWKRARAYVALSQTPYTLDSGRHLYRIEDLPGAVRARLLAENPMPRVLTPRELSGEVLVDVPRVAHVLGWSNHDARVRLRAAGVRVKARFRWDDVPEAIRALVQPVAEVPVPPRCTRCQGPLGPEEWLGGVCSRCVPRQGNSPPLTVQLDSGPAFQEVAPAPTGVDSSGGGPATLPVLSPAGRADQDGDGWRVVDCDGEVLWTGRASRGWVRVLLELREDPPPAEMEPDRRPWSRGLDVDCDGAHGLDEHGRRWWRVRAPGRPPWEGRATADQVDRIVRHLRAHPAPGLRPLARLAAARGVHLHATRLRARLLAGPVGASLEHTLGRTA